MREAHFSQGSATMERKCIEKREISILRLWIRAPAPGSGGATRGRPALMFGEGCCLGGGGGGFGGDRHGARDRLVGDAV